jgi:hypothetical protein
MPTLTLASSRFRSTFPPTNLIHPPVVSQGISDTALHALLAPALTPGHRGSGAMSVSSELCACILLLLRFAGRSLGFPCGHAALCHRGSVVTSMPWPPLEIL